HWISPAHIGVDQYGIDIAAVSEQVAQRLPRAELGIPDDALVVGTLGRMVPQKGFRYLLEAAAQVLRDCPQTIFMLVGDGEQGGALETQCHALGIGSSFRFMGAHELPWRLLAGCDVIALPSLWEGLWLSALEALAAGRPLVATRVGGANEFITHGYTG